jgi:hypothetical protein
MVDLLLLLPAFVSCIVRSVCAIDLDGLLPHDTHHQVFRLKFNLDDDDEAGSTFHLDTYNPTSTFRLPKTFMITRLWYNN